MKLSKGQMIAAAQGLMAACIISFLFGMGYLIFYTVSTSNADFSACVADGKKPYECRNKCR